MKLSPCHVDVREVGGLCLEYPGNRPDNGLSITLLGHISISVVRILICESDSNTMTIEPVPQSQALGIDEHNTSSPAGRNEFSDEKPAPLIAEWQHLLGNLGIQGGRPEIHGHRVSTSLDLNQEEVRKCLLRTARLSC